MNTTHLDDTLLQQIAIDKLQVPATIVEHYQSCITCRAGVEKYTSLLDQLAQEQRPSLSPEATLKIMAGLPLKEQKPKNYWLFLMISAGVFICLGLLWFLLKEFRKQLPPIASVAALLIVAIIVIYEAGDRLFKYQRIIKTFEIINQSNL